MFSEFSLGRQAGNFKGIIKALISRIDIGFGTAGQAAGPGSRQKVSQPVVIMQAVDGKD